jgi:hypothetical protein
MPEHDHGPAQVPRTLEELEESDHTSKFKVGQKVRFDYGLSHQGPNRWKVVAVEPESGDGITRYTVTNHVTTVKGVRRQDLWVPDTGKEPIYQHTTEDGHTYQVFILMPKEVFPGFGGGRDLVVSKTPSLIIRHVSEAGLTDSEHDVDNPAAWERIFKAVAKFGANAT